MQKFKQVEKYLNAKVFEMQEEIRSVLALLITKQHGFFLGVPGVGKSYLINTLATECMDVNYYKKLIMATTTPQEVFGPLNVPKLAKEGKLHYNTDGYLPWCDIAFLDEMFKGNSQTLNANLTAMNERQYENGSQVVTIPLVSLFAASNELPQDESLNALWDRFTARFVVDRLASKDSFMKLLDAESPDPVDKLTRNDLDEANAKLAGVTTAPIHEDLFDLRQRINNSGSLDLYVSDRRWKQVLKYMQGLAVLDGKAELTKDYFAEIGNCLWDKPEQIADINDMLSDYVSPSVERARQLFAEAIAHFDILEQTIDESEFKRTYSQVKEVRNELEAKVEANPDAEPWIAPVLDNFNQRFNPLQQKFQRMIGI